MQVEDKINVVIELNFEQKQSIVTDAEHHYPNECCGLLLGNLNSEIKTVIEVLPTENSWDEAMAERMAEVTALENWSSTKRDRFAIAPETLLSVQKIARSRNLDIIGVYHSHPDHQAIPSEFDRAIAWPQYSYIIVSVQQGKACDFQSWQLDETHQFQSEKILNINPT